MGNRHRHSPDPPIVTGALSADHVAVRSVRESRRHVRRPPSPRSDWTRRITADKDDHRSLKAAASKGRTVFGVPVQRFDVGAVPVPVFYLGQPGRGGHVQVGQDERVPEDVVDFAFQRQRQLGLVALSMVRSLRARGSVGINSTGMRVRRAMQQMPASAGHGPGR